MSIIRVIVKGGDHRAVDMATRKIMSSVKETGNQMRGPIPLTPPRGAPREEVVRRSLDIVEPNHKMVPAMEALDLPSTVTIEIGF